MENTLKEKQPKKHLVALHLCKLCEINEVTNIKREICNSCYIKMSPFDFDRSIGKSKKGG